CFVWNLLHELAAYRWIYSYVYFIAAAFEFYHRNRMYWNFHFTNYYLIRPKLNVHPTPFLQDDTLHDYPGPYTYIRNCMFISHFSRPNTKQKNNQACSYQ